VDFVNNATDAKKALFWLKKAAEQNHKEAYFFIGAIYDKGSGVTKDSVKAAYWYKLGAQHNDPAAQFNLGLRYALGEGVHMDMPLAHMWLNISASNGHWQAPRMRDIIESRMTSDELREARALARGWSPSK
jgi:TPR repeat protein